MIYALEMYGVQNADWFTNTIAEISVQVVMFQLKRSEVAVGLFTQLGFFLQ